MRATTKKALQERIRAAHERDRVIERLEAIGAGQPLQVEWREQSGNRQATRIDLLDFARVLGVIGPDASEQSWTVPLLRAGIRARLELRPPYAVLADGSREPLQNCPLCGAMGFSRFGHMHVCEASSSDERGGAHGP